MAEFATMNSDDQSIPFNGSSTDENALGLTNPDSILSGTNRGVQMIGSPSLNIDSTQNLITVKPSSTSGTRILRLGVVATNFLGLAVNNGTVDTMFAGQDSSGNTVIKIAKSGFDAKTATADQLVFNSAQNVFKIAAKSTTSVNIANNSTLIKTVTHNLNYIPVVLAYLNAAGDTWVPLPYAAPTASTPLSFNLYIFVTNITSTTFDIWTTAGNPGSSTLNVNYYLLQETAS